MSDAEPEDQQLPPNLGSYFLVFLRKGTIWSAEVTPASSLRQQQHLDYLKSEFDAGNILVYGPTEDPTEDLRGIVIMKVASLDIAHYIMSNDPHVKIGHLRVEIMPWWADRRVWRDG